MKKKIQKSKKVKKFTRGGGTAKKIVKKAVKAAKPKVIKPIGVVTHFYGGIEVAIVKFKVPVKKGSAISFRGATTDFDQKIKSMQYDHKDIAVAKKGQEVGMKVDDKVREGDEIFEK